MAFVIRDAVFIDHSGNNVRIQGNVQSNNEGLRVFFVCLFVCFFPKRGEGIAACCALDAQGWLLCDHRDWVWKLNEGFLDSHCKVSSLVYTGQHQCAGFVSYLLYGGFAVIAICL